MKTKLGLALFSTLFLLQSCKEKGVIIDFSDNKTVTDTTYVAPIAAKQLRNVLIEEFTGASCTNCPAGHEAVANIISSYPDRVIAMALHTFNGGAIFKPVYEVDHKSTFDFRDSAATDIGSYIYGGLNSIPLAGVDRVSISNSRLLLRTEWASETGKRISVPTSANLDVHSSYNSSENTVSLNVKVAYTENVTTKNTLTLGVIESDIIDLQKYPDSVAVNYVHNHILRKYLTLYYGKAILDNLTTKEAGRVYEYNYSFTPDPSWKLENCHIVAILSNNESDNKEVIQAAETPVK